MSKYIDIVNQLVKCLNSQQRLKAELKLYVFSGYKDGEHKKRAQIDVTYRGLNIWTFTSRFYKTDIHSCTAVQTVHGPFEEREAKTLLANFFETLASKEKIIAGQPEQTVNDVKKFFDDLENAVSSREELELRAAVEMNSVEYCTEKVR